MLIDRPRHSPEKRCWRMSGINPRVALAGLGLYGTVAATTYGYFTSRQAKPDLPEDGSQQGSRGGPGCPCESTFGGNTFDRVAATYDRQIGWDETLMGIGLLRWWAIRQAKGATLEVSAGTGRNLPHYQFSNLTSLTLTDSSVQMLEQANDKLDREHARDAAGVDVLVCHGKAEDLCSCVAKALGKDAGGDDSSSPGPGCNIVPCPSPLPPAQYDTVIDTFGLCSHSNPVKALKEMGKACKPGGQIILIEHGKASWDWLNKALDKDAERHYSRWGCWWNRDIAGLVEQSGLKIVSSQRWHFGTTYVIHATV